MHDFIKGEEYHISLPSFTTDDGREYVGGEVIATFEGRRDVSSAPQPDDGVNRADVPSFVFRDRAGRRVEIEEPHLNAGIVTPRSTNNITVSRRTIRDGGEDKLTSRDDPFEF